MFICAARRVDFEFEVTYFYSSATPLTANELKNAMDAAGLYEGYTETLVLPDEAGTTAELQVKSTSLSLAYEEQSCPANSAGVGGGTGEGVECICNTGYAGEIVWVSNGDVREYRGECVSDGTGATVAGVLAVGTAVATAATGTSVVAVSTAATTVAVEASAAATAAASSVGTQSGLISGVSSSAQGAATSVLAQMQLLALLSKVPGVYKRAPTFAATFRTSGWLNLQGIPGWWTSSSTDNSTNTTTGNTTTASRRTLAEEEIVETTEATDTDFYNCSLDSVSSSTSSLVPDQFADFMSAWFYTVVLIFLLALGQMVAFWVLSHCRPRVMKQFDREVAAEMDSVLQFLTKWEETNVAGRRQRGEQKEEGDSPIELVQVAIEESSEAKEMAANDLEGGGGGGGGGSKASSKRGGAAGSRHKKRESKTSAEGDDGAEKPPPNCFMKLVNQVSLHCVRHIRTECVFIRDGKVVRFGSVRRWCPSVVVFKDGAVPFVRAVL